MCGIAGIVGRNAVTAAPALGRMLSALRHRGPDDEGTWAAASGDAAFAHTRLAVIDPGPAGHQPMTTADGRYTVTFSGEIYNFRQLRRSLESSVPFRTASDTEVLLNGVATHGPEFVARLRGMFAFALWDAHARTCLLARDPFGLKPLYVHRTPDGALLFASEVRALLASRLVEREVDASGLHGYLRTGTVPEPLTLVRGIRALGAGHLAVWSEGAWLERRFWSPHFPSGGTGNHHREAVREALTDSVRHHFVSDVPVGIFLSGGVDSAALLALAAQGGYRGVRTLSMSLPGSKHDEGAAARRTADRFSARHSEFAVDGAAALRQFPQYLRTIDQPSIDGLNTYLVSRFAREQGLTVVLSGVGADELFGGYASFTQVPRLTAWNQQLSRTGPLRPLGGRMLEQLATVPRWRRVGELMQQPPTLANTYAMFRGIFTRRESLRIAATMGVGAPDDAEPVDAFEQAPTAVDEVSRLELTRYLRNQLARDSDSASMACGVELRAPFLDARLFETVSRVPAHIRLAPAKQLLRDAVPELPSWVMGPKRCFQFPFEQWLSGAWRPVFADVSSRSPVPAGTWYRAWSLFVLNHWIERTQSDGR